MTAITVAQSMSQVSLISEVFDMTAGTDGGDRSGFNDGPGPDYGTNSPANFKGLFVVAFRQENQDPDNFKVALLGTGTAQTFFRRVTITGDAWDEAFLTADADRFNDNDNGVNTSWEWDLTHVEFTEDDSYVVTLFG